MKHFLFLVSLAFCTNPLHAAPLPELSEFGGKTDAVVVLVKDRVVYERYGNGWSAGQPHATWSMSKSFLGALVGIAVREGILAPTDTVCRHSIEAQRAKKCAITIKDLLEWSSGLSWAETYEKSQKPTDSSVMNMLYGKGHKDMQRYVLGRKQESAPGSVWRYSSGDSVLLGAILRSAVTRAGKDFGTYPWTALFDPIGMKGVTWERDGKGTIVASSSLYAPARELAKLGTLFLNDGVWEGKRILPEGWVDYSRAVPSAFLRERKDRDPGDVSGAHWWLNLPLPSISIPQPWPGVPQEVFAAEGHWGQMIAVIPSQQTVAVRLGDDRTDGFDRGRFLKLVAEMVKQ